MTALHDPSTEAVIAECSTHGLDFRPALAFGREVGGPALRELTFAERGGLLARMSGALQKAREALIAASRENAGSTRGDAKFDVDGGIGALAYYARLGAELGGRRYVVEGPGEALGRAPRFAGYHVRVPRKGVAVHVNAFNFPVWGLCEKAACALLAGVPAITKPATSTALVAYRAMEALIEAADMPAGALQFVAGSVGGLLDGLRPEDVIAFTGSADTGAKLRSLPAVVERSVRVNVEADSLNSAVLGPDVSPGSEAWNLFIRHVVLEMTQKSGQKCTATRRVMVPRERADEVEAALAERLSAIRIGNPAAEGTDMGPLATRQQLADALKGIELLVADGCRVVCGGKAAAEKGWFLDATLLRHDAPTRATAVHVYEVFGPVATLLPYDGAAEAQALVARGEGSLVASVYSDDRAFLEETILAAAPWSGRLLIGSTKVADTATAPGMVLPSCVHGGPGRAGGGEELGGERGLLFYTQRTAIQGDRALLDRILGAPKAAAEKAG